MLLSLRVRNFAVVEDAEVSFGDSLTVITGATGSGKSVLVSALAFVLGGKADAAVVRDGAKEAEVEADFGDHVFRRTVSASGRTRAWIDDEGVTQAELRQAGSHLVDIHGPFANQAVLEESFQRRALDSFAGTKKELAAYAAVWEKREALLGEKAKLEAAGDADELDLLRFQVSEIDEAALTEEDDTIAERHAAAAHAGELVEDANAVTEALGGDDSAAAILISLQPRFAAMSRHLPEATEWATQAEELTLRLQELSRAVSDAGSKLEVGEESLDELDSRLTVVNRLKRKYGATVAEILAVAEKKRQKLDLILHRDERLDEVRAELERVGQELVSAGAKLSAKRRLGGDKLSKAVTKELRGLGFLQAKFAVRLEKGEPAAHGCDQITYHLEPNPGEASRPLAQIASSGEIARVMLALKSVLAEHDSTQTLVFDEIDANVGGEAGRAVGERLRAVAKHHQVLAITHLPQSAVFGERHLVVSKSVSGGRTRAVVEEIKGESRVAEIARMLGGEKLTTVVRRHAEELLGLSR